jgi:hypothetical protein
MKLFVYGSQRPALRTAIWSGGKTLWAFSRICYNDGITNELRETRYRYEAEAFASSNNPLETNS